CQKRKVGVYGVGQRFDRSAEGRIARIDRSEQRTRRHLTEHRDLVGEPIAHLGARLRPHGAIAENDDESGTRQRHDQKPGKEPEPYTDAHYYLEYATHADARSRKRVMGP